MIGCKTDGQQGPQPAPANGVIPLAVTADEASLLTYYYTNDLGVLATRGWHCVGLEGSNGSILFATPTQIDLKKYFSGAWRGIDGDGIQMTVALSGTSGRFEVAKLAARIFPEQRKFVRGVMAEENQKASDYPLGPYKADTMKRPRKDLVEFVTPPHRQGLGTQTYFLANTKPIHGFAALEDPDGNMDTVMLSLRFPDSLKALEPVVIRQAERDHPPGPRP
jgi:hypothetical protein